MMQVLRPGSTLRNGRYRIDKVLGQGGFGITYLGEIATTLSGEQGNMGVKVKIAIKEFFMRDRCMRSNDGCDVTVTAEYSHMQVDKYKSQFIGVARDLLNIHHPNIVNVSDVFEENRTVYYVMEYLPGSSLADKVSNSDVKRLTVEEAMRYVHQIADALDYLHSEKHICHFDVKPDNILLSGDDKAILVDLGIPKTFDDAGGVESRASAASYGNNYAPMELYQAQKQFSPQTDLYSLGATFYYMLTGNTPPEAGELLGGFPKCPYYIANQRIWQALELAMKPIKKERPDSVARWIRILDGKEPVPSQALQQAPKPVGRTVEPQPKTAKKTPMIQWMGIAAVMVVCCVIGAFVSKALFGSANNSVEVKEPQTPTAQALQLLSATDLTMARIQEIEKDVKHNGTDEEEKNLKSRINSLKHLYIEGLMANHHSVKGLYGIYVIHSGEYSQQQRDLMMWFFDQPESVKQRWERTAVKPHSLDEFKQAVEQEN